MTLAFVGRGQGEIGGDLRARNQQAAAASPGRSANALPMEAAISPPYPWLLRAKGLRARPPPLKQRRPFYRSRRTRPRCAFTLGLEHGGALPALRGHLQLHRMKCTSRPRQNVVSGHAIDAALSTSLSPQATADTSTRSPGPRSAAPQQNCVELLARREGLVERHRARLLDRSAAWTRFETPSR